MRGFCKRMFLARLSWLSGAALLLTPLLSFAQTTPAPVDVMIVGVFHMNNPGHDIHNRTVDDVLAPRRQAEIVAITNALARFKPNKIALEQARDAVEGPYRQYLAGTLPPSRNERVQLGFRLAKLANVKAIYGIDADVDFPYPALKSYADTHGFAGLLAEQNAAIDRRLDEESRVLAEKSISAELRLLNEPDSIKQDHDFYRTALRIGSNDDQPGVDLLTNWYRRNFLICANLLQISKPGDRIVVFYGAGHAFLLRQCVTETPGLRLVEANDYLQP